VSDFLAFVVQHGEIVLFLYVLADQLGVPFRQRRSCWPVSGLYLDAITPRIRSAGKVTGVPVLGVVAASWA
jgi:hypothetical protein